MRMRIGFALVGTLLVAAVSASPASAAVCTKGTTEWTNPNGGGWRTEANWSRGVPSKTCDAKITLAGEYGVAVGSQTGMGGVARSLTIGGTSGRQTLVDDNSTCGMPPCPGDTRLLIGKGGIKVTTNGALKLIGGNVFSSGVVRLLGGRMFGGGTITAKHGVANIGGLLALNGNGVISIVGPYAQDARSTMTVGVPAADNSASVPGGLSVSGLLRLDGKLRVEGPAPARTAAFPVILTGTGLLGTFIDTSFSDQLYDPIYSAKGMQLGPASPTPDHTAPTVSAIRFQPTTFSTQALLSFTASEKAKIDMAFDRIGPAPGRVAVRVVTANEGSNQYRLNAKPLGLKPGRYKMTLQAIDPAGNRSSSVSVAIAVRKS